jgi:PPOX class probable F420-dependent enzyme
MTTEIPQSFQDLLKDSKKAFAYLATTMKDGSPQLTKVWFDWDGSHVLVNTARERVKDINMRHRPQVAVLIADPDDDLRYIQIRGKAVEVPDQDAREHINQLAHKYTGRDFNYVPGQTRVIFKILAEHVSVD